MMEIGNISVNFAVLREHLQLLAVFLFALPLVSFLTFKFWIAARASKVQRTTSWFVPAADLDSNYAMERHHAHRNSPRRGQEKRA